MAEANTSGRGIGIAYSATRDEIYIGLEVEGPPEESTAWIQVNGFLERFHRILLEEHLRIQRRTQWYEAIEEMQVDLDGYLEHYNTKRPHQGRGMNGRTPY